MPPPMGAWPVSSQGGVSNHGQLGDRCLCRTASLKWGRSGSGGLRYSSGGTGGLGNRCRVVAWTSCTEAALDGPDARKHRFRKAGHAGMAGRPLSDSRTTRVHRHGRNRDRSPRDSTMRETNFLSVIYDCKRPTETTATETCQERA